MNNIRAKPTQALVNMQRVGNVDFETMYQDSIETMHQDSIEGVRSKWNKLLG